MLMHRILLREKRQTRTPFDSATRYGKKRGKKVFADTDTEPFSGSAKAMLGLGTLPEVFMNHGEPEMGNGLPLIDQRAEERRLRGRMSIISSSCGEICLFDTDVNYDGSREGAVVRHGKNR